MSLMSSLPWKIHSFSYIQWLFLSEPWTYPYSLTFFLPSFMHFQLHPGYFHLEIPALPGIQVSNPPVFLVPSSLIDLWLWLETEFYFLSSHPSSYSVPIHAQVAYDNIKLECPKFGKNVDKRSFSALLTSLDFCLYFFVSSLVRYLYM